MTTLEQPAAPETPQEKTPPWADGEFDAERAWKKIQALEADKEKLAKRPVLDDAAKQALADYEKLKSANQTELEKANEQLTRWQTDAEKWRTTAVTSKVQALAATEFTDPDDAVRNLDPSKYLDAGGTIDEAAIKSDLDALLKAKPHYRRSEGATGPRIPAPNTNQGSSGSKSSADPAQEFATILQGQLK